MHTKMHKQTRARLRKKMAYLELAPPCCVLSSFKTYFCGCLLAGPPVQSLAMWSTEPHLKQPLPADTKNVMLMNQ